MKTELAAFLDFLRDRGHRITGTRIEVAKRVFALHEHFSAEELQFLLRARKISRATVYRTLTLMVDAGLVKEHAFGTRGKLYEHIIGHPRHFHLVCDNCGAIEEIDAPDAERALRKAAELLSSDLQLLDNAANALAQLGDLDQAEKYARASLSAAEKNKQPYPDAYETLSKIYAVRGDKENAKKYHELYRKATVN
ncbi:MAG: Fur family transcriptional regulator [candidate division WOR-3 bacterium]